MKAKSGGGITSNKLVQTSVRAGAPRANVMSPAGVAQQGLKHAFIAEPLSRATMKSVPLGNQVALNVGKGGPGSGRTVMRSGTQGTHGQVIASTRPAGRDILGEFGPNRTKG